MSNDNNLQEHKARLTPAQQALLRKRLHRALAPAPTIARRPDPSQVPLSFAQERFWFLHQLDRDSAAYNRPAAFQFQGPLDITVLERAISQVVRRHELLRAIFPSRDGQPQQVILDPYSVHLPLVDLSNLPEAQRARQAIELARNETQRPFRLSDTPPWRASLLRLAPDLHILLLPMHHILSDAWSTGVVLRELAALHAAFVRDEPSPLPELPIQYADFAHWQRQFLQGEALERRLAYWKHQLDNLPPALELPSDRPRPLVQTFHGRNLHLALPSGLATALQTLSQVHNATLFMTLLAALQTLLHRYTGQEDIVVGSPVAGRITAETEDLVGCFINTLALRTGLGGNPTFRELLATVRKTCLEAYEHSDLPFEKLLSALNPARDLSRAPFFQVMFNSHLLPVPVAAPAAGLTLSEFWFDSGTTQFDLIVEIKSPLPAASASPQSARQTPGDGDLLCTFNYNTDLFDEATITRMLGHYRTLLEGIAAHPEERIGYLPLLTPDERQRMIVDWNRFAGPDRAGQDTPVLFTPVPLVSPDLCLHQLFEAQAERTPDAIALIFGKRQYTYRQLNARANALAHELIQRGVGPDVPVGVFIDYLPEVALAVLAILKAGGAYVPLNPDHPRERLSFIVRETAARCVLTQGKTAHLLPAIDIQHVVVDLDTPQPSDERARNPTTAVTPDHLAYIMYTSGSTGAPRGVLITHRALCNLIAFDVQAPDLGPGRRVTSVISLSFDPSARDFIVALAYGAALCVFSRETILSPDALLDAMREYAVTHASFPTSLLAALPAAELPALRIINVGGEACSAELVERWAPGRHLINVYGPTEATVHSIRADCRPDGSKPPIGHPMPNTQAYILDRHLQPVPVGVAGELYLAGVCLSRGYLNRPDATAEKFLPNPLSAEPGARMYRTGDLARYRPDGNIDFLGRSDFQTKIRGFRVEPGEVEAVLRHHPAVYDAVVLAGQDKARDALLTAYVVLRPKHTATPAELQASLRHVLPYYMVPSAVVLLEALPLTSSGKVDRRALPRPEPTDVPAPAEFIAPRTPLEELVAAIWADLLGLERVSVCDNFFQLGGHSLLATQVVARLQSMLGITLPVRTVFECPTVAELALLALKHLVASDGLTADAGK